MIQNAAKNLVLRSFLLFYKNIIIEIEMKSSALGYNKTDLIYNLKY